jgi:ribulose-5-phosphate 4-epimerase/fuculose-1-phosphate aldolase
LSRAGSAASQVAARESIVRTARSMFERGLTHGSTGNISLRVDGGWLMTPTGSSFGDLDPARLSMLDTAGRHVGGDAPTKEAFLHRAMYDEQPRFRAVVHLHSLHSVAVSVLADVDPDDVLPPLTAYYVMRVGSLPLVPYFAPGDAALADAVRRYAGRHHALLLANHGPVVAGSSLAAAADAIEELEATARLYLLLRHERTRGLTPDQVDALKRRRPA